MNQPDLGVKVAELRQQKGLTQEQLAEQCEVSPRTIQRIESGEVDPRAYTLQCLSKALEFDFATEISSNENLWLALLHLSSIICIIIIPLLLWSWKKCQSYKINQQGRRVLNFQITMALTLIVALFLLMIFPITLAIMQETSGLDIIEGNPVIMALLIALPLPLIFIGIFCTYQGVVNAMRSLSDKPIHYPLSIPFVR
jgi:transcriptional regulator with XRE-family HTH domain